MNWMWSSYVDAAEWEVPNVKACTVRRWWRNVIEAICQWGAYINRMSDSCRNCWFNPKKRVGDGVSLYDQDFLDRHRHTLEGNPSVFAIRKPGPFKDIDEIRGLRDSNKTTTR